LKEQHGIELIVIDYLQLCFHSYAAVAVPGSDDVELAKSLIGRWGVSACSPCQDLRMTFRQQCFCGRFRWL